MENKSCSDCGCDKPVTEFHKSFVRKDGSQAYFRYCKSCAAKRRRDYYYAHLDQSRAYVREQQRKRRAQGLNQDRERWYKRLRKYQVTREEWEVILRSQEWRCAICRRSIDVTTSHTDHCHETGKLRGLLCLDCNHGLGKFHDSVEFLENAIEYLQRSGTPAD